MISCTRTGLPPGELHCCRWITGATEDDDAATKPTEDQTEDEEDDTATFAKAPAAGPVAAGGSMAEEDAEDAIMTKGTVLEELQDDGTAGDPDMPMGAAYCGATSAPLIIPEPMGGGVTCAVI